MSATLPVGDAVTAMPVVAAHAAVVEMKPAAPQNPNQAAADVRLAVDAIRLANVGDHLGNYVEEQIVAAVANVDAHAAAETRADGSSAAVVESSSACVAAVDGNDAVVAVKEVRVHVPVLQLAIERPHAVADPDLALVSAPAVAGSSC